MYELFFACRADGDHLIATPYWLTFESIGRVKHIALPKVTVLTLSTEDLKRAQDTEMILFICQSLSRDVGLPLPQNQIVVLILWLHALEKHSPGSQVF